MNEAIRFDGDRALVTGGLGFIGSHVSRRLLQLGAEVTIADSLIPEYGGNLFNIHDIRDRVTVNITDVRDRHAIDYLVQGQSYIFNLAGQTSHLDSMLDPQTDLDINAGAQLSILEACKKHNREVKIVFASTRQLYGRPQYLPVDEKHPIRPVDVNGINKLAGECYHLLYNNVYGIRAGALRLTNTYGPGMRVKDARQTFLGVWIRNVIQGKPVQVFGDGLQVRDFNYVEDASMRFCGSIEPRLRGTDFQFGIGRSRQSEVACGELVELYGGGKFEVVPFPPDRKAIDIGDYYSDFSAIKRALGWTPAVGLDEGLKRTLDYFSAYGKEYWSE